MTIIHTLNPGNASVQSGKEYTSEDERTAGVVDATALDTVTDWAFSQWTDSDTFFRLPVTLSTENLWMHFRLRPSSGNLTMKVHYEAGGSDAGYTNFKLSANAFGANNSSSTPSTGGLSPSMSQNDFNDVDIHWNGAENKFDVYINGARAFGGSNGYMGSRQLSYMTFNLASSSAYLSEICFSDTDTRGWRVQSTKPASIGAQNDFSGSLSDIQTTSLTEAAMSSPAAGSVLDLNFSNVQLSGMKVVGVNVGSVADIVGTPDSPVLEYSLFDGTDEHLIGYRVLSTETDANLNQNIDAVAPLTGGQWSSALIDTSSLRIRNVAMTVVTDTDNLGGSPVQFGYGKLNSTIISGDMTHGGAHAALYALAFKQNGDMFLEFDGGGDNGFSSVTLKIAVEDGPGGILEIPHETGNYFRLFGSDLALRISESIEKDVGKKLYFTIIGNA
ncbi:hypothetical protein SM033_00046 [Vibrio phage vB_VpaM_sm033]|nr:hypothetical protein SM033_00046 [Vibrio phage vB_VpaM_sm033]